MLNDRRILAIIPARGGSKRLPNKNILPLLGKPLIAWTIESAIQSKYIDHIVVSTDSIEIKNVSEQYGASVPFLRPAEFAEDTSDTNSVIKHCLDYHAKSGDIYDVIVILQPTSPLRVAADIDGALVTYNRENAKGIVSVCECEHSPLWANILPENNSMEDFIKPELRRRRSQDLPTYYRLNGAIYIYEIPSLVENDGIFYSADVKAHIMHQSNSVDIDTDLDFKFAELLLQKKRKQTQ